MTCKDCIHFGKEMNIDDKTYHLCTDSGDLILEGEEDEDCEMCLFFQNNDGTYHNGTWHCPRCGKEVSVWGLCGKCEQVYSIPKGGQVKPHMLQGWVYEEDDSWESVSK